MNLREAEKPCRGCGKREIGCHGKCPEWLEWEREHAARREELRKLRAFYAGLEWSSASTAERERTHKREWREDWKERRQ